MKKLIVIIMLSLAVSITSACGSDNQSSTADLDVISNNTEEEKVESEIPEETTESVEEPEVTEVEEEVEEEPVDSADEVYPSGYAPSESGEIPTGNIIGEYTSDNGNVYSVNFYTSGEDERVGIIYLNRDKLNGGADESNEIVAQETNVYMIYQDVNAYVFDFDGADYWISYYKDGKLWDRARMTKAYQPS